MSFEETSTDFHQRTIGQGETRNVMARTFDAGINFIDTAMRNKYDHDSAIDMPAIERVAKVAADHSVPMAQIALAWQWARDIESPIVGCSKPERADNAVAALSSKIAHALSPRSNTARAP